jgi:hypothetical protein
MTARRLRSAVLTTALVAALAGCAGKDGGGSAEPAPETSASETSASETAASATPSEGTSAAPSGQRIEVEVSRGQVSGDTGRVSVPAGEQVTLVITGDTADEVHVHGYDLTAALNPGGETVLSFTANLPGVFEVELHDAHTVLLTLEVS